MAHKILIAIDSFKGCLSSAQANAAAMEGALRADRHAEVVCVPMSDGGEGMLEAFEAVTAGKRVTVKVHDALGDEISADYLVSGDTAYIETAQAVGLTHIAPERLDALAASSRGAGELIAHAARGGARRIVVGLGGSATSDAGIGMLEALGVKVSDESIDMSEFIFNDREVEIVAATDVTAVLCGPYGMARIFAPQKGARTAAMVDAIEARALRFAHRSRALLGRDCSDRAGAGAAGGMGFALMAYCRAACVPGAELLLDLADWDRLLADALCVFTGEGRADRQTLMGKLPYVVARRSRLNTPRAVPVILLAGEVVNPELFDRSVFNSVIAVNPEGTDSARATAGIADAVQRVLLRPARYFI